MMMVLFILALLSMPIAAFAIGLPWLGWVFVTFYLCFGVFEITAKIKTGKTISQHVTAIPIKKRLIVIGAMILGWGALIIHFLGAF